MCPCSDCGRTVDGALRSIVVFLCNYLLRLYHTRHDSKHSLQRRNKVYKNVLLNQCRSTTFRCDGQLQTEMWAELCCRQVASISLPWQWAPAEPTTACYDQLLSNFVSFRLRLSCRRCVPVVSTSSHFVPTDTGLERLYSCDNVTSVCCEISLSARQHRVWDFIAIVATHALSILTCIRQRQAIAGVHLFRDLCIKCMFQQTESLWQISRNLLVNSISQCFKLQAPRRGVMLELTIILIVTHANSKISAQLIAAHSNSFLLGPTWATESSCSAAGPWVWNYLPTDLRQPDLSYSRFRQSLKTFLFGQWTKAQCESIPSPPHCWGSS